MSEIPVIQPVGATFGAVLAAELSGRGASEELPSSQYPAQQGKAAYERSAALRSERRLVVLASQIMTSPAITIASTALASEAQSLMRERRFRHLPVVDPEGKLVGIISDRDLHQESSRAVDSFMIREVLTSTAEAPVREIADIMLQRRISALPILDGQGRVAGIITTVDLLRAIAERAPIDLWG